MGFCVRFWLNVVEPSPFSLDRLVHFDTFLQTKDFIIRKRPNSYPCWLRRALPWQTGWDCLSAKWFSSISFRGKVDFGFLTAKYPPASQILTCLATYSVNLLLCASIVGIASSSARMHFIRVLCYLAWFCSDPHLPANAPNSRYGRTGFMPKAFAL